MTCTLCNDKGHYTVLKHDLHCPQCGSANWHPAGRDEIVLPTYAGEIGVKH